MADEHMAQRLVERFLRAGLSRSENQRLVRHLLADCRRCSAVAAATSRATGVTAALSRFGGAPDADPARYSRAFASILGPEAEAASRTDPHSEPEAAEAGAPAPMLLPAG